MKCKDIVRGPLGLVFFAHVLSSWGDRMWWFAGGIFMKDLAGFEHESLLFVGVYSLMLSGVVLLCGACIGRWIDSTPRLKAIQIVLVTQNSLLIVCIVTVVIMFMQWDTILRVWNGLLLRLLQAFVISMASLSQLASVGTQIIVQKDWLIVICDGDMDQLATFNTVLRTIDLTTQIIAPLAVGFVREQGSKLYSAIMIGIWNLLSMIVEYYIFSMIYRKFPKLKELKQRPQHTESCPEKFADHSVCPEADEFKWCCYCCRAFQYDWKTYFSHSVRFAGLGLAFLYMTVLGFDAVTTAYSDTQIRTSHVAVAQGAAALVGVLGSASFPVLRKCTQQESIGLLGLGLEVSALILCVVSIWMPGSPFDSSSLIPFNGPLFPNTTDHIRHPNDKTEYVRDQTSIIILCAGIIFSRFGLWLTDITITQIMQEKIAENKRGVVNGVQDSLNMGMDMVKSTLVIAFPEPQQFGLLIIVSFCVVCCGLVSYSIFYCQIKRLPFLSTSDSSEEKLTQQEEHTLTKHSSARPASPEPIIDG